MNTPKIDKMIGIMNILHMICDPSWIKSNQQYLHTDGGYLPDDDVKLTIYTWLYSEPIIEISYDDVIMNFSFFPDFIELSFWKNGIVEMFSPNLMLYRTITEEQFFQLSLIHDTHWMTFEIIEHMIRFENLLYEHLPRPETLKWVKR